MSGLPRYPSASAILSEVQKVFHPDASVRVDLEDIVRDAEHRPFDTLHEAVIYYAGLERSTREQLSAPMFEWPPQYGQPVRDHNPIKPEYRWGYDIEEVR